MTPHPSRAIPWFSGFLVLFLHALSVKFYYLVHLRTFETGAVLIIGVDLLLASVLLARVFHHAGFWRPPARWLVAAGVVFGFFTGITLAERTLSEKRLNEVSEISAFRGIVDHCGVHSGRAVIRIFDRLFMGNAYSALREYRIGTSCRLNHFIHLEKNGLLGCKPDERAVRCRIRWMSAFSERGFWNYEARRYFFEDVMGLWKSEPDDEGLVNFVLEDQNLQVNLLDELQQAGVGGASGSVSGSRDEESLKNEAANRELSRKIFQTVAEAIRDGADGLPPEPWRFRFHDAYTDYQAKSRNQL